jgi:hypothetical protein
MKARCRAACPSMDEAEIGAENIRAGTLDAAAAVLF